MSNGDWGRRFYMTREPLILTALSVVAVLFFVAVTGLSHVFLAQQDSLANRWFARGVKDLQAQRYAPAVFNFRSALLYSRDNYSYQFNLAEALIGEGRRSEASAYLQNLWEREPENGHVNLDLARIAAQQEETEKALRYYHNAIYATWSEGQPGNQSGNQEVERRDARVELVRYLLGIGDRMQAQSELIALAANLDGDPAQHMRAGDLFFEARDYEHALGEYELTAKAAPRDAPAWAGAGQAAFELGRYGQAERNLQAALQLTPSDAKLAQQLNEAELAVQMDPFQRQLPSARRYERVMEAFAVAGERLKSCPVAGNAEVGGGQVTGSGTAAGPKLTLDAQWVKMKPQITEGGLRRNPELVEAAMDLVFEIERRSEGVCGIPSGRDMALLRIAKLHQGS